MGHWARVVLLVRVDRGVCAHRSTRAPTDLTGGGLGWLRERISGREKKRKERGKRAEREKKEVFRSFGVSKFEFILFSVFRSNISFLRISIRIFEI